MREQIIGLITPTMAVVFFVLFLVMWHRGKMGTYVLAFALSYVFFAIGFMVTHVLDTAAFYTWHVTQFFYTIALVTGAWGLAQRAGQPPMLGVFFGIYVLAALTLAVAVVVTPDVGPLVETALRAPTPPPLFCCAAFGALRLKLVEIGQHRRVERGSLQEISEMPVHMLADRAEFKGRDQRGDLRFLHRDGEMVRPEMDQSFHERCLGLERQPCTQGDFADKRVAHTLRKFLLKLRPLGLVGRIAPCPKSEGLLDRAPHRIRALPALRGRARRR